MSTRAAVAALVTLGVAGPVAAQAVPPSPRFLAACEHVHVPVFDPRSDPRPALPVVLPPWWR